MFEFKQKLQKTKIGKLTKVEHLGRAMEVGPDAVAEEARHYAEALRLCYCLAHASCKWKPFIFT